MPAQLRGYSTAGISQRALAHRKHNKLTAGMGCIAWRLWTCINICLLCVIEHNMKESWKAEKQFNFVCTRRLATEFSFPFHVFYPQMAFCFIPPISSPPLPPVFLPLSSLTSPSLCEYILYLSQWPGCVCSQASNISTLGRVCVQPAWTSCRTLRALTNLAWRTENGFH